MAVTEKKKAGRPKKEKPETVIVDDIELEPDSPKVFIETEELERLKKYEGIVKDAEEQQAAAIKSKTEDYSYFGDFEKGSAIPARDMPNSVDILDREVSKLGSMIRNKEIPLEELPYHEADYKKKKDRLDAINASKPNLTGLQKDKLKQKRDKLAGDISASKFTRLQMEKGLADPHEEARRMSEPCIEVDVEEARRMRIPTHGGMVSRSVAENMWKMMSSLLGDTPPNPNAEILRTDTGFSKRSMVPVDVDIKDGKVIY